MAQVDPTLAEPTPTGALADRADIYRLAVRLINDAGFTNETSPEDALYLAQSPVTNSARSTRSTYESS